MLFYSLYWNIIFEVWHRCKEIQTNPIGNCFGKIIIQPGNFYGNSPSSSLLSVFGSSLSSTLFLIIIKTNCCCSWIHYCSVPCRFCIWNAALGLWYLGPILNPYCWSNLNQEFQNASCWSSRYRQAWICLNECELMLSNAFLHLFWVIFETRINIPTIVLMDYNIRCSVRNSDELDP